MASFNQNTQAWCSSCGKGKSIQSFTQSLNENHNKYLPFCKTCVNAKLRQYREETGSDGAALYCVCAELGYPMIREYYDIAVKIYAEKGDNQNNNNLFICYHNTLRDLGFIVKGFWQSDMDLSEFVDFGKPKKEHKEAINPDELVRTWGKFEADDYELLESFYDMYTQDILEMEPAMEMRYRDLCKAELRKRKADENGEISEITKAEDSLRKNMAMLKLDNFNNNKQSDIEKHIERLSWMIENTKPSECEDLEKYKDFSKLGIKWEDIQRCTQNLCAGTKEFPNLPKGEL